MQFDSFQSFLYMQGHGVYVWAVYGIALLVLTVLLMTPIRRTRLFFTRQAMLLKRLQNEDDKLSSS